MHGAIYSASFLSVISTPDCLMASPNDLTPSSRFNTSRKSQVSKVVKNSPEKAYTTYSLSRTCQPLTPSSRSKTSLLLIRYDESTLSTKPTRVAST